MRHATCSWRVSDPHPDPLPKGEGAEGVPVIQECIKDETFQGMSKLPF